MESNKNVDASSVFLVQSSQNEGIQTQRYVRISNHGILVVAMERFEAPDRWLADYKILKGWQRDIVEGDLLSFRECCDRDKTIIHGCWQASRTKLPSYRQTAKSSSTEISCEKAMN